jgi:hypothetical protein
LTSDEEIAALRAALDEARAQAAELRVRLQRAHGALDVWRERDPVRAFNTRYDLEKLLRETRPDVALGVDLLIELHELRASRKGA